MAAATYRAPSALHRISFLTLPSPARRERRWYSATVAWGGVFVASQQTKTPSFLFSRLTQGSVHSIYSWEKWLCVMPLLRVELSDMMDRLQISLDRVETCNSSTSFESICKTLKTWNGRKCGDLATLLQSWVTVYAHLCWRVTEFKV